MSSSTGSAHNSTDGGPPRFPATRHSLIEALGAADPERRRPAFDLLVASYWRPVYRYLRAIRRMNREDAEDLAQDFFVRALEKDTLASFDPSKARFRTFLRVCLDRFGANWHEAQGRQKRGGHLRAVPIDPDFETRADAGAVAADPDQFFRREWIRSLFEGALADVTAEYESRGKPVPLAVFLAYDIEPPDDGKRPKYAELARRFEVPETQITNFLAGARRAFRRAALARLRAVTADDADFEAEARDLFGKTTG
ncbi:MAG: RNA polymerase sigma factor [Gemmatimonadales bacterium]